MIISEFEGQIAVRIRGARKGDPLKHSRLLPGVPTPPVSELTVRRREHQNPDPAGIPAVRPTDPSVQPAEQRRFRDEIYGSVYGPSKAAFVRDLSHSGPKALSEKKAVKIHDRPSHAALRYGVQGEHVDKHTLVIGHMLLMLPEEQRVFAAKLAVAPPIPGRNGMVLEIKPVRIQFCPAGLPKALILPPEHGDVGVIVPGDESAVTHRPEKSAGNNVVMDPAFSADPVHLLQKLQFDKLQGAQGFVIQLNHLPLNSTCRSSPAPNRRKSMLIFEGWITSRSQSSWVSPPCCRE